MSKAKKTTVGGGIIWLIISIFWISNPEGFINVVNIIGQFITKLIMKPFGI